MASTLLLSLAGSYCRNFPLERGKWRVAERLGAQLAKTPLHRIVKLGAGIVMDLDTSDFVQREVFIHGDYEPAICTELKRRLKPGDTFLDVGANVGYFTLLASKCVGPAGLVYAFEPAPGTKAILDRNIVLNAAENVISIPIALSDEAGRSTLFLNGCGNSGASSLRPSPSDGGGVSVILDSFDRFAARTGCAVPSLVKIDVEGAEVKVLRGMSGLLSGQSRPAVILEVSEYSLTQMKSSKDELFGLMIACGYEARLLSRPRLSIFSGDNLYFQYDVLFTPKKVSSLCSWRAKKCASADWP